MGLTIHYHIGFKGNAEELNCTKTQYAEQFVKCHLLVVKVLDLFKEQGFNVKIKDEGHFWETRDLKVLAKNINDYTDLIKDTLGVITEQAKKAGPRLIRRPRHVRRGMHNRV